MNRWAAIGALFLVGYGFAAYSWALPLSVAYSGSCPSSLTVGSYTLPLLSSSQAATVWGVGSGNPDGLSATYGPYGQNIATLPTLDQYPAMGARASDAAGDPPVYVFIESPSYVYYDGGCELRTYTPSTTTTTTNGVTTTSTTATPSVLTTHTQTPNYRGLWLIGAGAVLGMVAIVIPDSEKEGGKES